MSFWEIVITAIVVIVVFRIIRKITKYYKASAEKARMEAEALEEDNATFDSWAKFMEEWAKEIPSYEPNFKNLQAVFHTDRNENLFSSNTRFYVKEEKFRTPVIKAIQEYLSAVEQNFLDEIESTMQKAKNVQELADVYSKYFWQLRIYSYERYYFESSQDELRQLLESHTLRDTEIGEVGLYLSSLSYFRLYSNCKDFISEWSYKLKVMACCLVEEKLIPITVNDVLVFNKVCYLYGDGRFRNDNDDYVDVKWFVCENEVLIYREGKSQSLPIMRIVNLKYNGNDRLELEVLVRANSFTTVITGDSVVIAEKVIKAIQTKHMSQAK